MNPLDDLEHATPSIDADIDLLREVAAAVDYLRRGARPSLTVWDAVEEALRWSTGIERNWDSPDPLADALRASVSTSTSSASILSSAFHRWVEAQSATFNDRQSWYEM